MKLTWDQKILLKLKRQYSRDETIKMMNVEMGKMQAYIHELEDQVNASKQKNLTPTQISQLKTEGWVQDILKDEYILELQKQIKGLQTRLSKSDRIKKLEKELEFWRNRACHLAAKYEKI